MGDQIGVVQVVTRMNVGGVARHVALLHEHLDRERFHNKVLFGRVSGREAEIDLASFDDIERIDALQRRPHPGKDPRAYITLLRRLRTFRPAVVHTHMTKAGALGRVAARRAAVPVVLHTYHGHVLSGYFPGVANRAVAAVERRLARRTDALVAVSETVRDELLELGIGSPSQWHVIPYRLDLSELTGSDVTPAEARARLGLPNNGPIIGIVGRLTAIKDHRTFFDAATRIAERFPETMFVVAGDGELRDELEARARAVPGGRVRFLGWVKELPLLYGALDVVVLTSRNEGSPYALIEAGAAGRPVVATRVGGVPEVVEHERTGLLVGAGASSDVADAVISLLARSEEERRTMGLAARALMATKFSSDSLVQEVTELYLDLLQRKGSSAAVTNGS